MGIENVVVSIVCIAVVEMIYAHVGKKMMEDNGKTSFYFGKRMVKKTRKTSGLGIDGCAVAILYLLLISFLLFITVFLFLKPEWKIINDAFNNCFNGMSTSFLALFAVLGILKTWNEMQNWIYSQSEIFEHYRFLPKFQRMMLMMVCYVIFCFLAKWTKNEFLCAYYVSVEISSVAVFYICMICLLWQTLEILFSTRAEEKMLGMLYQEFWHTNVRNPKNQIPEELRNKIIFQNMDILLDNFSSNSLRKVQYDNIEFGTNLSGERYEELKKKANLFVLGISTLMVLYINIGWIMEKAPLKRFLCLMVVEILVTCFFTSRKGFNFFMVELLFTRQGYRFYLENCNKPRYASDLQIRNSKYAKYIKSIKSFLAFFEIVLEMQKDEVTKEFLDKMKIEFEEVDRNKRDFGLLLIVMDYLYYTKHGENFYSRTMLRELKEYRKFAIPFLVDVEYSVSKSEIITEQYDRYFKEIDDINGIKTANTNV